MTLTLIIWAICSVIILWWEWDVIKEETPRINENTGYFFTETFIRQFIITFFIVTAPLGIIYNIGGMLRKLVAFPLHYKGLYRLWRINRKVNRTRRLKQ